MTKPSRNKNRHRDVRTCVLSAVISCTSIRSFFRTCFSEFRVTFAAVFSAELHVDDDSLCTKEVSCSRKRNDFARFPVMLGGRQLSTMRRIFSEQLSEKKIGNSFLFSAKRFYSFFFEGVIVIFGQLRGRGTLTSQPLAQLQ